MHDDPFRAAFAQIAEADMIASCVRTGIRLLHSCSDSGHALLSWPDFSGRFGLPEQAGGPAPPQDPGAVWHHPLPHKRAGQRQFRRLPRAHRARRRAHRARRRAHRARRRAHRARGARDESISNRRPRAERARRRAHRARYPQRIHNARAEWARRRAERARRRAERARWGGIKGGQAGWQDGSIDSTD